MMMEIILKRKRVIWLNDNGKQVEGCLVMGPRFFIISLVFVFLLVFFVSFFAGGF